MKKLRSVFWGSYIMLIVLLLLLMLLPVRCNNDEEEENVDDTTTIVDDPAAIERARQQGGMGDLKVTLLWDQLGDVDLHAIEPNGSHIYYSDKHPRGSSGQLDVDNTAGGNGSAENICWSNLRNGVYKVYVHYYSSVTNSPVECTIVVFQNNETRTYRCKLTRQGQRVNIPNIVVGR